MGVKMSEESKVGGAQPESTASGVEQEVVSEQVQVQSTKDSVAYDTYKRTLAEAKKAKARAAELEEKTIALEQDKLASEGKKDELIASLKEELTQTKGKVGNLAFSNLQSQLETEAAKFGCVNPDLLAKAVDLTAVDIDKESLRGDSDEIKSLVEEAKQKHPYLFAKSAPKFEDPTPGVGSLKLDTSKMTSDELKEYILKNHS